MYADMKFMYMYAQEVRMLAVMEFKDNLRGT